jgi:hypothetical protein
MQDRNLRVAREELAGPLRDLLQKFYPPDNRVRMTGLRAVGAEVEFEFSPERTPPAVTGLAARLRGRYCTFRRQLIVHGQPAGEERWYWMNPEKPFVIPVPSPFGVVELVRGKEEIAEALKLLDRLPRDNRVEDEQFRFLVGPPHGELLLPADRAGVSGFDGGLIISTNGALFVRNSEGRWGYAGEGPGWYSVVSRDRVYCTAAGTIRSRPLAAPAAEWETVCPEPPLRAGEKAEQVFVAGDRLYQAVHPNVLCSRPLANPAAEWTRVNVPLWSTGHAVTRDTMFGNDRKHLYSRPTANPNAEYRPVGPWPGGFGPAECSTLVADGDRLLAFGGVGPIYARPVKAGPDEPWTVVGRVHDPYQR